MNAYKWLRTYLILGSIGALSLTAHADGSRTGVGGGGDVYACPDSGSSTEGKPHKVGFTYFVADLFSNERYRNDKEQFETLTEQQVIDQALNRIDGYSINSFGVPMEMMNDQPAVMAVSMALDQLQFREIDVVPEVDDDGLPDNQFGCVKMQAMKQYLGQHRVDYSGTIWKNLGPFERALFRLHEALISLEHARAMREAGNTQPIRSLIYGFFSDIFLTN